MRYLNAFIYFVLMLICFSNFLSRKKLGQKYLAFAWLGLAIFEVLALYGCIRGFIPLKF